MFPQFGPKRRAFKNFPHTPSIARLVCSSQNDPGAHKSFAAQTTPEARSIQDGAASFKTETATIFSLDFAHPGSEWRKHLSKTLKGRFKSESRMQWAPLRGGVALSPAL